jgi:hypothetical protein
MRQVLRKSVPFMLAIILGTMAAALVASFALYASHT